MTGPQRGGRTVPGGAGEAGVGSDTPAVPVSSAVTVDSVVLVSPAEVVGSVLLVESVDGGRVVGGVVVGGGGDTVVPGLVSGVVWLMSGGGGGQDVVLALVDDACGTKVSAPDTPTRGKPCSYVDGQPVSVS